MSNYREKAQQGLTLLEEAVVDLLEEIYPNAMRASDIRDALGIKDPLRGYNNYLTDSLIKRLEERGIVRQVRYRGPWQLARPKE